MTVTVGGVALRNPVLLASGILGSTGASLDRALRAGAGGVVTKSMGPEPREGHPGPNVYTEDGYALNAVGLSNPSYGFSEELAGDAPRGGDGPEGPVIVSIYAGTADGFASLAEHFAPQADALELNVSCPHAEGYGTDIGADPDLTRDVTAAAVDAADVPVWVKLTPNVADVTAIGRAAEDGGASAVTAVNTLDAMAVDVATGRPILGNVHGGLSGSALKPVAVRAIYELYGALDVPVIGVGGVGSAEDAAEMLLAGASAVQVGTAVRQGVEVLGSIADGLGAHVDRHGGRQRMIGLAHEQTPGDDDG